MRTCVTHIRAKAHQLITSRSRPYHSLLKREWVQLERNSYASIQDVTTSIARYNAFYNDGRETNGRGNLPKKRSRRINSHTLSKMVFVQVYLLSSQSQEILAQDLEQLE